MKHLSILIIAIVAVMATSCGKSSGDATADSTTASAPDTVAKVADPTTTAIDEAPATDAVITLAEGQALPDNGKPVVIDFNATWCGPCKQFAPVFHQVAGEYADKATFVSVDVDIHPELAEKYSITNIPCVVILAAGKEPVKSVGSLPTADFKDLLNKSL
ncbi:MAG: thioredoxin domain-containing protein [Bacteroides sp.]|nr:thioredoxin domain-containing protein [Bacteroides sp.]MCM1414082.1 thioredoxin domain-containing protein [Bacteroides sp.]MCM1472319.1 thioredoxin domain-containing protein [Bacteroides sp.]